MNESLNYKTVPFVNKGKNTPLLLVACEKMWEKQQLQRTQVYDENPGEASSIATNVTYSTLCRNELAQKVAREAISVARSSKNFYRQEGKKLIKELDKALSSYDTTIAMVAGQRGEELLEYADGFTDLFVERAIPLYNQLRNSVFVALLPFNVKEAELISHFEAASILFQFAEKRLEMEIETFKNRSYSISTLGYLSLGSTSKKIDKILDYINKHFFPKDKELRLNQQANVSSSVNNLFDYIGNIDTIRDCMTDFDEQLKR